MNVVVVRENTGGVYFGRSVESNGETRHEFSYRDEQVQRILGDAIGVAQQRRRRLALVVKPSGVPGVSRFWRERFDAMTRHQNLETSVLEVDNAAYQIVANPRNFDVIVAPNLFGDVLSDVAALLLGSRGLSYSANLASGRTAVYQTGHGAAHDLAGKGLANPIGQILAAAMRRYWMPVAANCNVEVERAQRIRLLCEDLVLYRDARGRPALLAEHCPHRGTSLALGCIDQEGIRCPYHGWKFDAGGQCLETPAEPDGSTLHQRVRATAYPVQELGGLVFV